MRNTIKQSIFTSTSTVVNGLLGIAFFPLLARLTSIDDFALFSICILTMTLLADIANVGTDTGIVRFVGKYVNSDRQKAYRYLKFGLKIKIVASFILFALGFVMAPLVANEILHKPEFASPLRVGVLGSISLLLFSFTTSSIQALEKFKSWSVLTISLNSLRLIAIFAISIVGVVTLPRALLIYATIPLVGFFIGIYLLPKFYTVKNDNSIAKEFLHYNKWVALFILVAAVSSRLDSYLVTRYLSIREVGIYSAAVTLTAVIPQLVAAIATVVAPKLSKLESKQEVIKYLTKLQLFLLSFGFFIFVAGSLISFYAIPGLFGSEYVDSIKPFVLLLFAQIVFLISIPCHSAVIYYFGRPQLFVIISIVHLAIIFGLGTILIQSQGVTGAAITMIVGSISNFFIPLVWAIYKLHNDND